MGELGAQTIWRRVGILLMEGDEWGNTDREVEAAVREFVPGRRGPVPGASPSRGRGFESRAAPRDRTTATPRSNSIPHQRRPWTGGRGGRVTSSPERRAAIGREHAAVSRGTMAALGGETPAAARDGEQRAVSRDSSRSAAQLVTLGKGGGRPRRAIDRRPGYVRRDVRLRMSGSGEREARSVALEKAYVHEVYEQICVEPRPARRDRPWPRVSEFLAGLEPGSVVCDVGCGNGKYLNVNPSVFKIGADRCHSLVSSARKKNHEVLACDNLSLPFRDESFDAVLSVAVVHHFATTERRAGAIRELARVLRIGGRLVITVWAMEQRHRKFESQDVLVPWHRQQHPGAPLDLCSATTTASEEDAPGPRPSPGDPTPSPRHCAGQKKGGSGRHRSRHEDSEHTDSPGSSGLSSPNETCYSFVRRALQKLAGTKTRARVRPWFLESWGSRTKEPPPQRHDPEGCEDIQDLPIELRRLEDEPQEAAPRRQDPAAAAAAAAALGHKSQSLTDIPAPGGRAMVRSRSSVPSLSSLPAPAAAPEPPAPAAAAPKPKLVKQKKSICEEDMEEEGRDEPTDMRNLVKALPEFQVAGATRRCGGVFKQSSMNEELMSTERLREKERVRQNIQKQASLNEELIFRRNRTFDSLRDSFLSTSTAKRFQILASKLKSSTTGIEKVAGTSFKNGFVRILQGWKGGEAAPQPETSPGEQAPSSAAPPDSKRTGSSSSNSGDDKKDGARRHSREDGSDSSKDSSLQSDTSVDSEDSFASVIFVPKQESLQSDPGPGSPAPTTSPKSCQAPPTSPKTSQSAPTTPKSLTSPSAKTTPLASAGARSTSLTSPNTKPPSLTPTKASPVTLTSPADSHPHLTKQKSESATSPSSGVPLPLAPCPSKQKPAAEPEKKTSPPRPAKSSQFQDLLSVKPAPVISRVAAAGVSSRSSLPLVRRASTAIQGRPDRPLPRLLSLELFNPETDDMDSDSSGVSSPDSVGSVVSVLGDARFTAYLFMVFQVFMLFTCFVKNIGKYSKINCFGPIKHNLNNFVYPIMCFISRKDRPQLAVGEEPRGLSLLEAAADVASSLEETVDAVIRASPRPGAGEDSWDEGCRRHLADFADKLSEKLLEEIDQYRRQTGPDPAGDPYLERLSEELSDLTRLSEELQEGKCRAAVPTEASAKQLRADASVESPGTASLASDCSKDLRFADRRTARCDGRSSSEEAGREGPAGTPGDASLSASTSQESLPSDGRGGALTFHRYYHVFREGELDRLIERHAENLHIISSYYDHANWCVVAEKVQVWTI
ncbi:LOW QUALITY PROTEIN: uncharacterized protein LOC134534610 [Bacillus rossius redtenbacheri]|uniref:LOW QUALITY PROTEIN: uncharacterized protein LOC134534610 n=1 Tax=Bacillus rossius redtenbacheri TaxID=93214 RepID=UPI002FDD1545